MLHCSHICLPTQLWTSQNIYVFRPLCLDYPSFPAPFLRWNTQHLIGVLHPPGRCLWPSHSMSGTFYSCAPTACYVHIPIMVLTMCLCIYLLMPIFLNRWWTFWSLRSCIILLFTPLGWTQGLVSWKCSLAICWIQFLGSSLCTEDPLIHSVDN